jgi:type VI secretion system protein VasG
MLSKFAIDLTAMARQGKIAPVVGRDAEMIQIEQTLLKHSQNNPILLGDPGVGKTAVVEGFASRIVAGECPEALRDVALMSLDIGGMMAGAGVRGEFESRLKGIIRDVRESQRPIVLFIDEIHNLIGAGNQAGVGDAANLLKPALARGELRTIGATTWAEYKKHVEKDPALVRRFSPVKILEPGEEDARIMIRAVAGVLEKHHKVTVLEEAVDASVRLSKRYIPERQLPDKARSLLDTACAAVSMSQSAVPKTVQDARRRLQLIKARREKLEREVAGGMDRADRIAEVDRELEAATARCAQLEQRWKSELELLSSIRSAAAGPEAGRSADPSKGSVASDLRGRLRAMQGDAPMVHELVDADAIARTVSEWTGIPAGRMAAGQAELLQSLESRLAGRIIGQPDAMVEIARSLRTSSADLGDPRKPRGVFFLVGPSGVGKTETAVAIAELLYGGRQAMTAVNLSEFQEDHKVATLLGPPPGYVGADEGGILTEAARRRPYSVILLDEAEKAKPAVNNIFLKLFDEGSLSDGMGRLVDFRNTTIFVTSNVGSSAIVDRCNEPGTPPDHDQLKKLIEPELLKHFRDEYLKRMSLIVYRPLSADVVARVVQLRLDSLVGRVRAAYGAELAFDPEVVPRLASRCVATQSGARVVEQVISRSIQADLAAALLGRTDADAKIGRILVRAADDGTFKYEFQ